MSPRAYLNSPSHGTTVAGHSAATMRGYIEEGSLWNDNAATCLGL